MRPNKAITNTVTTAKPMRQINFARYSGRSCFSAKSPSAIPALTYLSTPIAQFAGDTRGWPELDVSTRRVHIPVNGSVEINPCCRNLQIAFHLASDRDVASRHAHVPSYLRLRSDVDCAACKAYVALDSAANRYTAAGCIDAVLCSSSKTQTAACGYDVATDIGCDFYIAA